MDTKIILQSLTKYMSSRVPENLFTFFVSECKAFEFTITLKWSSRVPPYKLLIRIFLFFFFRWNRSRHARICIKDSTFGVFDFRYNKVLRYIFINHFCYIKWAGLERSSIILFAINSDLDWLLRMIFCSLNLSLEKFRKHFISSLQEIWSLAELPLPTNFLLLFLIDTLFSSLFSSFISLSKISWLFLSHFVV